MKLQERHYNLLTHLATAKSVIGWGDYSNTLGELEEWKLVSGTWTGDMKAYPIPKWELTTQGKNIVKVRLARTVGA